MAKLTLYGVPLSQPFRSVAWALLLKRAPFKVRLAVPGSPHPTNGTRGEEFRALTRGRTARVPVLRDEGEDDGGGGGNGFVVHESPAILTYLCQKHGWTDLYPSELRRRTRVDEYNHWHHEGTRCLSRLTQPALRPDLPAPSPALGDGRRRHLLHHPDEVREQARAILDRLDSAWLSQDAYLAGPALTVSDLLCYGEVSQAVMLGAASLDDGRPHLAAWAARMGRVDFHDPVHAALAALGDELAPNDESADAVPLAARLGVATKAGLKALDEAQAAYATTTA
jgi:glutathione S-transferase